MIYVVAGGGGARVYRRHPALPAECTLDPVHQGSDLGTALDVARRLGHWYTVYAYDGRRLTPVKMP